MIALYGEDNISLQLSQLWKATEPSTVAMWVQVHDNGSVAAQQVFRFFDKASDAYKVSARYNGANRGSATPYTVQLVPGLHSMALDADKMFFIGISYTPSGNICGMADGAIDTWSSSLSGTADTLDIGKYDPGNTASSDVLLAEFSLFDFALDPSGLRELAKGTDPRKLGQGPRVYISGTPEHSKDYGYTAREEDGVYYPNPPFLQR